MRTVVMLAMLLDLPPVTQSTPVNCGPACLTAVLRFYGQSAFEQDVAVICQTNEYGTTPKNLVAAVLECKLQARGRSYRSMRWLQQQLAGGRPVIVMIRSQGGNAHYVVAVGMDDDDVSFFDPWTGRVSRRAREDFIERWTNSVRWSNAAFYERWFEGDDMTPWCRWGMAIWGN